MPVSEGGNRGDAAAENRARRAQNRTASPQMRQSVSRPQAQRKRGTNPFASFMGPGAILKKIGDRLGNPFKLGN